MNLKTIRKGYMSELDDYRFIELLTANSLESGSMEQTLDMFAEFSGMPVAYIESAKNISHISRAPNNFSENIRLYPLDEVLRIYKHFPVTHAGNFIGSIILNTPPDVFFPQNRFLPHLANALKICGFIGNSETLTTQSDESFINILLTGNSEDIAACKNWLKQKKIDPDGKFCAVAIYMVYDRHDENDPEAEKKELHVLYERFKGIAKCFPVQFISCIWNCFIVFDFLITDDSLLSAIINNFEEITLHHQMDDMNRISLLIGVGDKISGYDRFSTSWAQSVNSIKYSMLGSNDKKILCLWSDVGIDQNIADMASQQGYLSRCVNILEPLLAYDRSHRGILFPTLVAFTINQWNLTASAKYMFLHYNSIKYRYNNIASIMNLDLDSSKTRFDLAIIVRTYLFSLPMEKFLLTINHINNADEVSS